MAYTAAEQYMLELINRARLDPAAEAARLGISLNTGLAAGTLGNYARQVLAPNAALEKAASLHSIWMLNNDIFSHTGANGSSPTTRVQKAGYVTTGAAENLSWSGTTGSLVLENVIADQHRDLFLSKDHRPNILGDSHREVGIAQEEGLFSYQGHNFNSAMVTQNFSKSGDKIFVTGVAYNDRNGDQFYSMGEGASGVSFAVGTARATTAFAGGYSVKASSSDAVTVTGSVGSRKFKVEVSTDEGNAKLDVVNGNSFHTSVDITLKTGIHKVKLLGLGDIDATGNFANNAITGNKGKNTLSGADGADTLSGMAGNDKLVGGKGNDILSGGVGSDTFVFSANGGVDKVTDYTTTDRISLDDAIWGGGKTVADVVDDFGVMSGGAARLDFGNGQVITFVGLTSLAALESEITII